MKKISKFSLLAFLFAAVLFVAACTKEEEDIKLEPKLATAQVLDLGSSSATVIGYVIAQGDGFTERGCVTTSQKAQLLKIIKLFIQTL